MALIPNESGVESKGSTMLAFFTDPYPDEILYSVIARLWERLGGGSVSQFKQELFGRSTARVGVPFPCHIQRLIDALPEGHQYSTDTVIGHHTLLPLYAPFLPPGGVSEIRSRMCGDNAKAVSAMSAMVHGHVRLPNKLRYCPTCLEKDRNEIGETYWHRVHQVPGVRVCDQHGFILIETSLPDLTQRSRREFVTANSLSNTFGRNPLDMQNPIYRHLQDVARDVRWLLDHDLPAEGLEALRERYLRALAEVARAQPYMPVSMRDFVPNFETLIKPHLKVDSEIEEAVMTPGDWFDRLTGKHNKVVHPYLQLVFIHVLGHTAETFFAPFRQHSAAKGSVSRHKSKRQAIKMRAVQRNASQSSHMAHRERTCAELSSEELLESLYKALAHTGPQKHATPPAVKLRQVPGGRTTVDWSIRDEDLWWDLVSAVQDIRKTERWPRPITFARIKKYMPQWRIVERNRRRLPRCDEFLETLKEPKEAIAIRRIQWTAVQYQREGVCPKRWEFIKQARVHNTVLSHPDVVETLETALDLLDKFPIRNRVQQLALYA